MRHFLLLLLVFAWACTPQATKHPAGYLPQEGDLVFRRGTGGKSRVVLQTDTQGLYSHVGVVVRAGSAYKVVHAVPGERDTDSDTVDKVKMDHLHVFFEHSKAQKGAILRFVDSAQCGLRAAAQANRLWRQQVLFDHHYNLHDSSSMYCTELVWHVYLLAGRDVTQGRRSSVNMPLLGGRYIYPSDIYNHTKLVVIYKF